MKPERSPGNRHPVVRDELAWFSEIQLAMEFRGHWSVAVRQPPPFPVMCAECLDAPISLEVYVLESDGYPTGEVVAADLVRNRLEPIYSEVISRNGRGWEVTATGREVDLPTSIWAQVIYANDVWYVLAFSGWEAQLNEEVDRARAMVATAMFGSQARGVDGVVDWVGSELTDGAVQMGRSRRELGFLRAQSTVRLGRPARWMEERST
jgi:hypothetical protein